jgi:hypothetical protein
MANDKEEDQVTRQVREIHPRAGNQGSSSETRIASRGKQDTGQGSGRDANDQRQTIIHDNQTTRLHISSSRHPADLAGTAAAETSEPVTGWLVATAGPGRGKARAIFEGMNSVGRDAGQRISLNFNDGEISRHEHFFVTYEPKKRSFHISNGVKSNLVYLNGDVVLAPMLLTEGDEIEVGETKLRFVPLCGPKFSWDEA